MEYVGKILTLCKGIIWMVDEVKTNKKRCRRLAERVKALEELVQTIRTRGLAQMSRTVNNALWKLSTTLTTAQELVKKCTKTKFLNLLKCKSEFNIVNESLNDTFQVLSGALQVDQGSMIRKMFQDYAMEEDDDDWDGGLNLSGAMAPVAYSNVMAPVPYSGVMAPVRYPPAVTPIPYLAAAAPRPQPTTAVYAAMMEVEDDSFFYAEAVFLAQ